MRRTACRVGSEAQHDNGARAVGVGLGAQECVDLDGCNGAPCRRIARLVCRARRLEPRYSAIEISASRVATDLLQHRDLLPLRSRLNIR
jgi:hypothetical protein